MSKNYSEIAEKIIANVGGKANVSNAMHCYTRLRLNLKDTGLVNVDAIKDLGIIGTQFAGNQLQVIIGNDINEIYEEFIKQTGLEKEATINENIDENLTKKKLTVKGVFSSIIESIVSCIVPLLPILIASGLFKTIILVCQQIGIMAPDSPTGVTLTFVADAAFYFMPVIVGGFAAKKFGANTALGCMIGGALIHPTFVQMVADGNPGSIFGLPIYSASYSSTIIPVILSVWIMSYIEKFISKYSPKNIRVILEPTLTLLIITPLALCLLAPLGAMFANAFAVVTTWFYDKLGFIAVAILCAIMPFVVMLGIHLGVIPVAIGNISTTGADRLIMPAFLMANFTQGTACLAVGFKSKDPDLKSFAFSSAFSNIVPGISEPGMYGITLRYKTPMIGAMIGSAAGGLYFGITKVGLIQFLPPNLFALVGYVGSGAMANNLINAIIGFLIGMVVAFVVTMIIYKPEEKK